MLRRPFPISDCRLPARRFLGARLESRPDDITDRKAGPELTSNPRGDAIHRQQDSRQSRASKALLDGDTVRFNQSANCVLSGDLLS